MYVNKQVNVFRLRSITESHIHAVKELKYTLKLHIKNSIYLYIYIKLKTFIEENKNNTLTIQNNNVKKLTHEL